MRCKGSLIAAEHAEIEVAILVNKVRFHENAAGDLDSRHGGRMRIHAQGVYQIGEV